MRVNTGSRDSSRHREKRPWGGFEQFALNETCSVKILEIEPGQQLSLQSHKQRSERWIVLDEAMDVEVDGHRFRLERGEDVIIPAGSRHRAFGLDAPCRWLEIAFGFFEEADIDRYEDVYGRLS